MKILRRVLFLFSLPFLCVAMLVVGILVGVEAIKKVATCAIGGGLINPTSVIFKAGEFVVDQIDGDSGKSGETFTLDQEQRDVAATIIGVGKSRGLGDCEITIALMTGWQESGLHNLPYGDRHSLGVFQQQWDQGWGTPEEIMNVVYATNKFYDALVKIPQHCEMKPTQAAQAVQRSAFPDAYAKWEGRSKAILKAADYVSNDEVAVVGDSLTKGVAPYQTNDLHTYGWDTATVDGEGSRAIANQPVGGVPQSGLNAVARLKSSGVDPPDWIVALGTNDVALIKEEAQARQLIQSMLDAIGSDKRVMWVNVFYQGAEPGTNIFNTTLRTMSSEKPNLMVFDWASVAVANPQWLQGDGVHYNSDGYRNRSLLTAAASVRLSTVIGNPNGSSGGGPLSSVGSVMGSIGDFLSPCNLGQTVVDGVIGLATGQIGFPWILNPVAGVRAGIGFTQWAYDTAYGGVTSLFDSGDPDVVVAWKVLHNPTDALPGDIIVWEKDPNDPNAVEQKGLYMGNNQVIMEPKEGEVVTVKPINWVGVREIRRLNEEANRQKSEQGWAKPIHTGYTISSPFGMRVDPADHVNQLHDGVDMAAPAGTKVYSAGPGEIIALTHSDNDGNAVHVSADNGNVEIRYVHLESFAPDLKQGKKLKTGDEIGVIGDCKCRRYTGVHLHFLVHVDGQPYDPVRFMSEKGVNL